MAETVESTAAFKQPHEDVPRPYGDDPLLSLDDAALPFRNALLVMNHHLQAALLVGNPAPIVERMFRRTYQPEPGDLVLESTGFFRRDPDSITKSFGRLVLHRKEWWTTDEDWEAIKSRDEDEGLTDADRSTDHAWYVQYGPDHVCRWTNCKFTVVPADFIGREWPEIVFERPTEEHTEGQP